MARGVAQMHAEGVLHRDIARKNVIITQEIDEETEGEKLVFVDFGNAKVFDNEVVRKLGFEGEVVTMYPSLIGTPSYAAPEAWRGQTSTASDVYSLCCLIFELFVGDVPIRSPLDFSKSQDPGFRGQYIAHVKTLETQPVAKPESKEIDLVWDQIEMGLAKKPDGRPSAESLYKDLLQVYRRRFRS